MSNIFSRDHHNLFRPHALSSVIRSVPVALVVEDATCHEHHLLRAHSTGSSAARSIRLRQERALDDISRRAPALVEERALLGTLLGTVTDTVKSLTDLLLPPGNNPPPASPPSAPSPAPSNGGGSGGGNGGGTGDGNGGGDSNNIPPPGSGGANPGNGQPPAPTPSPNPSSGNPGSGNPGSGNPNTPMNAPVSGDLPLPNTSELGTPTPTSPTGFSSNPASPSSTSPSNSGPRPANQGTAEGGVSEGAPGGSSGTSDGVSLGDSLDNPGIDAAHYQSSPNVSSAEEGDGASSGELGGAIQLGVLQASSGSDDNGFSSRTVGVASTTDANGNVVPVPTSTATARKPTGASSPSSKPIGIGIAVAVTVMAFLTALLFLRRRRIAKRRSMRQKWWSSRQQSVTTEYDDRKFSENPPSGTSPFSPPTSPRHTDFPTPPPMAEVRKPANVIDHPISISSPSGLLAERRLSRGSLISFASLTSSNGLPPGSFTTVTLSEESASSGRSSRNTSPLPSSDELFSFPPPRTPEEAVVDRTSAYFQPRSPTLSRSSSTTSGSTDRTFGTDGAPPRMYANVRISSSAGHDPFADPAPYDLSDIPQTSQYTANSALRYSASNSIESNPLSSGCGSLIASSCYNNFEEFEKIYVPFIGTLSDELSLRPGDEVRVLKIFEDGWALVVRNIQDGAQDAERGFIPASCLSERLVGTTQLAHPPRVDSYTMSTFVS